MATEKNKKNVFFDVINSVKGGSGKSTFALGLAHYLIWTKEKVKVFVIDLDLRGSSWKINFENTFYKWENAYPDEKEPYIDRLIMQFDNYESYAPWAIFETQTEKDGEKKTFFLSPANDEYDEQMDELEIDMFEQSIYKLIKNGLTRCNSDDEIHFILDMPPSYESHAERILKHLLTNEGSVLYRNNYFNEDDAPFSKYKVNVYMMASASPDHIIQNSHYLDRWINSRTYGSAIEGLISEGLFFIQPILNDITNVVENESEDSLKSDADNSIQGFRDSFSVVGSSSKEKWLNDYIGIRHFKKRPHSLSPNIQQDDVFFIDFLNNLKSAIDGIIKDNEHKQE